MLLLEMSEYLIYGFVCIAFPLEKVAELTGFLSMSYIPNTLWGFAIFGYAWFWEVGSFLFKKDVSHFPLRWWLLWSFAPFVALSIAWGYSWLGSRVLTYEMCLNVLCLLASIPFVFYTGKILRWLARKHKCT